MAAYRSGLEEKIAGQIEALGSNPNFEAHKIPYRWPARDAKYTADMTLPNGIVIETKGLFSTEDRQKMKLVKAQYPDLDIRMIFSSANSKIAKGSKTTYAKWCETNGFKYAHKEFPKEWLAEPPNVASLAVLKTLGFVP